MTPISSQRGGFVAACLELGPVVFPFWYQRPWKGIVKGEFRISWGQFEPSSSRPHCPRFSLVSSSDLGGFCASSM